MKKTASINSKNNNNNRKVNINIEYTLTEKEKKELEGLAVLKCCEHYCLKNIWASPTDHGPALSLLKSIRRQISIKSFIEKKDFLRKIVIANNPSYFDFNCDDKKLRKLTYTVGNEIAMFVPIKCCFKMFCLVYEISDRQIKNLRNDLRSGYLADTAKHRDSLSQNYNDDSMISKNDIKTIVTSRVQRGLALTDEEISLLRMPNSILSKLTSHWMETFFSLVGDHMPNKANEIHLEPTEKKEIWLEYVSDCGNIFKLDTCMGYTHFVEHWYTFFNHVKIREFKAVSGKCYICSILSSLRKKFNENVLRAEVTELHALHRITYMSERRFYYAKIKKACDDRVNYLSLIGDGMAEAHTSLPWLCNLREYTNPLVQHLQGILVHGHVFRIFRSFPFTDHNSNLACYCFLSALELHYRNNDNKLPDTIYYQVDGGSENSNVFLLSLCELLIIRRLTKRIYLTRLPVGHTHEDIDSKYGKIWKSIRNSHQYTPQDYGAKLSSIFEKSKLPFELHDYFVVPDFKRFFMPTTTSKFIDEKFSSYSKKENTQLAWKFVAVKRDKEFPLGCKTYNKTYCSDTVYEIIPDTTGTLYTGYRAAKVISKWMPQPSAHNATGGMYLIKRLPNQPIFPAKFSDKGKLKLDKTCSEFSSTYGSLASHREHQEKWSAFVKDIAPQSDDVYDYIRDHLGGTFHVPFKDVLFPHIDIINSREAAFDLFNGRIEDPEDDEEDVLMQEEVAVTNSGDIDVSAVESAGDGDILTERSVRRNVDVIVTGESVQWSNRGVPLPSQKARLTLNGDEVLTETTEKEREESRLKSLCLPRENYKIFTNAELKEMCIARGLPKTAANKTVYIERLEKYDADNRSNNTGDNNNTIISDSPVDDIVFDQSDVVISNIANSNSFNVSETLSRATGEDEAEDDSGDDVESVGENNNNIEL